MSEAMSNAELIAAVEGLLRRIPLMPWRVNDWSVSDANGYEVIADMSGFGNSVHEFLEKAPGYLQQLVDALKEASETNGFKSVLDEVEMKK